MGRGSGGPHISKAEDMCTFINYQVAGTELTNSFLFYLELCPFSIVTLLPQVGSDSS